MQIKHSSSSGLPTTPAPVDDAEPLRRSNRLGPRGSGLAVVAGGGSRSSFGDILRFVHDMPSGDFGQDVQDSEDGPDPVSSSASCRSCSSCPNDFFPAGPFSRAFSCSGLGHLQMRGMRRRHFPNHCVDPTASSLVGSGWRLSPAVDHARR
jgi:hypothetical protein